MAGRRQPYTEQEHGERLAEQAWRDKLAEAAREHEDFRLGPIDEGINEGKAALDARLSDLLLWNDMRRGVVELPPPHGIGHPSHKGPAMRSLPQAAGPVGRRRR